MKTSCEQKHKPIKGNENANAYAFVEYLECLAGYSKPSGKSDGLSQEPDEKPDRAALAKLRRTLGKKPDQAMNAFPYIVRWTEDLRPWHEQSYYLVAALFGMYPSRSLHHQRKLKNKKDSDDQEANDDQKGLGEYRCNLGASFLKLDLARRDESKPEERSKSLERRFTALLMSRKEDLPERLRHAIKLLQSEKIPIDWVQLLLDLCRWDQSQRAVSARRPMISSQRSWAKAFWRVDDNVLSADATDGAEQDN
ncbi:MAG: type I-E CRISPR-associated protein Cse2/CasB [Acidobacteria bacterium]|nr:type I-E CRISPR-associated protein Cse2/CasB [Acidobacteriota bacterium]